MISDIGSVSESRKAFIGQHYRPEVKGGRLGPVVIRSCDSESQRRRETCELPRIRGSVVLGPRSDFVLKLIEMNLEFSDSIRILYYEDLGPGWVVGMSNGMLHIRTLNEILEPSLIYVRGTVVEPGHELFQKMGELYEMINAWSGRVLCRPLHQTFNESKPYQSLVSLRRAAAEIPEASVKIIPTQIVKLSRNVSITEECSALPTGDLIVKSLSGVRSVVASRSVFSTWDTASLRNLPTQFQQRIDGWDLRVHYFMGKTWGIQVSEKSEVDYRYAESRSEMREFKVPEGLSKFCARVAEIEGGELIGFDFLVKDGTYYCLEANPGPGWAWYHENDPCEESFLGAFLSELRDEK